MRSPHGFVVKPNEGKLYKNTTKIGSMDFILSSSIENHNVVNREAIVSTTPSRYQGLIKDGAKVIVHHNVFRKTFAYGGREQFSSDKIEEGTYLVPVESVYAYKNSPEDKWSAVSPWCFVRPSKDKLHGEVVFGKDEGSQIVFIPDSEYEFRVDGETLYRIDINDICLRKELQEN
jgi:hypothetical protein